MFFLSFFSLCFRKKVVILQPQNGGTVAQLVEQRTENPRVTGSIPVGTTTCKETRFIAFLFFFIYLCLGFLLLWKNTTNCVSTCEKKRFRLEALLC